jgi:hypothetical protein
MIADLGGNLWSHPQVNYIESLQKELLKPKIRIRSKRVDAHEMETGI